METRRDISFSTLTEVLDFIESITSTSPETSGQWSYYQILKHIADFIEKSYDPSQRKETEVDARTTDILFRRLKKQGKMQPGHINPALPREREEGDVVAEINRVKRVIQEFNSFNGPMNPDSTIGNLTKEQYEFMHSIHAAMHLSFVN